VSARSGATRPGSVTPLAIAGHVIQPGQAVAAVEGAVLGGVFGLVTGRAAASVGRIAVEIFKQGFPAIGDAAPHHAHRAAFANGGAGGPIGSLGEETHASQPRARRFGGGAAQGAK